MIHEFKLTRREFSVISEGNTQPVGPPPDWAWKSEGTWGDEEVSVLGARPLHMGLVSPQIADILEPVRLSESCKKVKRTVSPFLLLSYSTSPLGRPWHIDLP